MDRLIDSVITALITPFTSDYQIYKDGLRDLLDFQLRNGVKAFFICGTYGLGPVMDVSERKKVAELVAEYASGKAKVIVHVGSTNVDEALDLAKHAKDLDVYAIASVPPYYYAYDDEAVVNYYSELVSKVDIPVFAYNNPARTGIKISGELLKRLADAGIAGVKDSSFDLIRFYEDLTLIDRENFIFIIGTESLMFPAMIAGAETCVSGLSNAFPELVVKLYDLIINGKYSEASKMQLSIIKVRKVLHSVPVISAVYDVLRLRGIDVGVPKKPHRRLNNKEIELLRHELIKLGLLR